MVEVATGPSDSATREKVRPLTAGPHVAMGQGVAQRGMGLEASHGRTRVPEDIVLFRSLQLPMVLKVPRLNLSPLALCDRPFSLLGFGDILVPGAEAGGAHGSCCGARPWVTEVCPWE